MKSSFSNLLFVFILIISSCSNENNGDQQMGNSLLLEANDQMQFNKNELRAAAEKAITLTLTNTGKMDKEVMGHDFVLLKQGTNIPAFGHEAINAKRTGFIPPSQESKIITHTKILGPGESDTITFTINQKGTYDYICSFPGHYLIMKGKLIVE